MRRVVQLVPTLVTLITLQLCSTSWATLYNLSADWSDVQNPNGVWSYWANGALGQSGTRGGDVFIDDDPPQIWCNSANWLGWSKSIGTEPDFLDVQAGDVYGHTGPLEVRWTSPADGVITVTGGVWHMREWGRYNSWSVLLNGSTLANGTADDGDGHGRDNPWPVNLTTLSVKQGDDLAFQANSLSGFGDYIGLSLTVDFTPIPEPTTCLAGLFVGSPDPQ